MKIENDNVFYLDDSPQKEMSMTKGEADQTTEETWSEVKNYLQDLLWRAENADDPAFDDQTILAWITQYSKKFDQFYQEKRATQPEQLLTWWEESKGGDNIDAPEFIREWVAFKNHTGTSSKESATA